MSNHRRRKGALASIACVGAIVVFASACTTGGGGGDSSSSSSDSGNALSGTTTNEQLNTAAQKAVKGRTLAFVLLGTGSPLWDEWNRVMKIQAEAQGFTYVVKDSNSSATKQADIVRTLVNQLKPRDVLVIHNADVSVNAKAIQQAEAKGIYVINFNLNSSYKGDAFVGPDSVATGRSMGRDIGEACNDKSGKVAVLIGDPSSAVDVDLLAGVKQAFKEYPKIKIVAQQAHGWVRSTGHDQMATILQQHPDLCASVEDWDQVSYGTGLAIRQAGLQGKVKVFTTDSSIACLGIKQGLIHQTYSFNPGAEAMQAVAIANYLVQSDVAPGASRIWQYAAQTKINSSNYTMSGACYDGKGGDGLTQ